MKRLLFAIVAILILFLVGWLSVSNLGDRTSINVETEEIREDSGQIMDETQDLLREAGDRADELLHEADERIDDPSGEDADPSPSSDGTNDAADPRVEQP